MRFDRKSAAFLTAWALMLGGMSVSCGQKAADEKTSGNRAAIESSKSAGETIDSEKVAKSDGEDANGGREAEKKQPEAVTILGAGDNLIHDYLYDSYETETGYDFSPCYENVASIIESADISVINSETPMAAEVFKPSSWPCFNTPLENADALKAIGFDLVCQGNNHTFDKGQKGVEYTLKCWSDRSIPVTGVYHGEEDLHNMRIIEKNGIKVAFLAFVELSNVSIPDDSAYQMVFLQNEGKVEELIKEADQVSDIVVVNAHWGVEDQRQITKRQEDMAQKMVNWGADVIFGSHSHCLQQLDILTRESDGERCPVAYSLGNFISAQHKKPQLIGGLMQVRAVKNPDSGQVRVEDMEFIPTITHFVGDRANSKIYLAREYTEELAAECGVKNFESGFDLEYINNGIDECIPGRYQNQMSSIYD